MDLSEVFKRINETWTYETIHLFKDNDHVTMLDLETDTLPDGSHELFWYVTTYRLKEAGDIDEIINNTGSIDNQPEALQNYAWHLDLYYGKTLEEVMPNE
jgi:hypothetical protein